MLWPVKYDGKVKKTLISNDKNSKTSCENAKIIINKDMDNRNLKKL